MSIPGLPKCIKEAATKNRLIIFVGAGLSSAVGLDDWKKVQERMIKEFVLPAYKNEQYRIELETAGDPYVILQQIKRDDLQTYNKILTESLMCSNSLVFNKFSSILKRLRTLKPASIVTTNIDNLFEGCGFYDKERFRCLLTCNPYEIQSDLVFCLHGNLEKNVFIHDDRQEVYQNEDLKNFLYNIFGSYTVLFLGYSLSEDHLLNYAMVNHRYKRQADSYLHCALVPSDISLSPLTFKTKYGIELLKYDNADGQYKNFVRTIESWTTIVSKVQEPNILETGSGSIL